MYQPGGSGSTEGTGSTGAAGGQYSQDISGQNQPSSAGPPGQLKEAAGETVQQLGAKAGEIRERAREGFQVMADRARQEASVLFQRARDQSETLLNQGKDRVAQEMGHFAAAVRETADRLNQHGDHNIAGYAEDMSAQLDRASRYLRERDMRALVNEVGDRVRRRPGLFFAGMFIGGLVVARFLKSSRNVRFREQSLDRGEDWTGQQPQGGTSSNVGTMSGPAGYSGVSGSPDDAMAMAGASPAPVSPGSSSSYGLGESGPPSPPEPLPEF